MISRNAARQPDRQRCSNLAAELRPAVGVVAPRRGRRTVGRDEDGVIVSGLGPGRRRTRSAGQSEDRGPPARDQRPGRRAGQGRSPENERPRWRLGSPAGSPQTLSSEAAVCLQNAGSRQRRSPHQRSEERTSGRPAPSVAESTEWALRCRSPRSWGWRFVGRDQGTGTDRRLATGEGPLVAERFLDSSTPPREAFSHLWTRRTRSHNVPGHHRGVIHPRGRGGRGARGWVFSDRGRGQQDLGRGR